MNTATVTRGKLSKATRKKARPKKKVSQEANPVFSSVLKIELKNLRRHPDNRHPKQDDVAETAASFKLHGQLEAILVRQLPGGRFEILSGETRFLAAKLVKWKELDARSAAKVSDAQALKLIAAGNMARHDLDPVQRARLLVRLCQPSDELGGGGGLSQEEAGAEVGLSRSAVSNCMRLLKLSDPVLRAVSAGRLPESYARTATGLFDGPGAAIAEKVILKSLPKTGCVSEKQTRHSWTRTICSGITGSAKRIKKADKYDRESSHSLNNPDADFAPTFFKITALIKDELQFFEFEKKTFCANRKRWKQLNIEAAKEIKLNQVVRNGSSRGNVPKMTPAQRKQKDARTKVIAEAKLAHWRAAWLSELICEVLELNPEPAARFLNWVLVGGVELRNRGIADFIADQLPWAKREKYGYDPVDLWKWFGNCDAGMLGELTGNICCFVLRLEGKPEYPIVEHEVLDGLAKQCGINLQDKWYSLPFDAGGRRHLFYSLQSADQLDAIGDRCGCDLSKAKTRQAKIDLLLPVDDVMPIAIKPI